MKILKKIFYRIFSELNTIYYKDIYFIKNSSTNSDFAEKTKLYEPFSIYHSQVGKGTYIAENSKISYTNIGKFCSFGLNLVCGWGIHPINGISTSPFFYSTKKQNGFTIAKRDLIEERKRINIGNDVFIGANVTILDGISIGDGAIIGAGSVVSKDIPDYAVAYGVPIKIVKYRFNKSQIRQLKEISWWDLEESELIKVRDTFFDIDNFIKNNSKNV